MAVRFDATDQLSRTANLPGINNFTLMAWVYFVGLSGFGSPFGFGANDPQFVAIVTSGTTLQVFNGASGISGSTLSTATWYHIALTCSGTGANLLLGYLNGALNITTTIEPGTSGTTLQIGRNFGGDQLNGRIAHYFAYDAVLTAVEISQQMRQAFPIRTANLKSWTPFHGSGDIIDYAGGGNSWTVSGTLTTEDNPPISWSGQRRRRVYVPSAGGTVYSATIAGAVTPVGGLSKKVNKVLIGSVAPVGAVVKSVGKVLAGSVSVSGQLVKRVGKVFVGVVTPVGTLGVALRRAISLVGVVTPVGIVVKRVDKVFSGAVVPVGSVTKVVSKVLGGSVALTGVVVKQVNKVFAGAVSGIGALISDVIVGGGTLYEVTLAGAVGLSGALTKQVSKVLGRTITPTGSLVKIVSKSFQGSVAISGSVVKTVNKVLAGIVTPVGIVIKRVSKSFVGVVTPVGSLTRGYIRQIVLAGVITPVGALVSSVIAGGGVVLRTIYPLFRRKRR